MSLPVIGRLISTFSIADSASDGTIDRRILLRVLNMCNPEFTVDRTARLLAAAGMLDGRVRYEAFISWLFHEAGDVRSTSFSEVPLVSAENIRLKPRPDFSRADVPLAGDVFVHGAGDCDQLGLGETKRERKKPTLVSALSGLKICAVTCGGLHTMCKTADGKLYSWGCGDDGALGRPSGESDCEPMPVSLPSHVNVHTVACGDSHSIAMDHVGCLWLWGSYKDSSGYIGILCQDGAVVEKNTEPTLVSGLNHVVDIACGANHTLALTGDHHVFAWGSNQVGQLGLLGAPGSEFAESELHGDNVPGLQFLTRVGSGVIAIHPNESEVSHIVSLRLRNGDELDPREVEASLVQNCLNEGAVALALTSRSVPLLEKQQLLRPQQISISGNDSELAHAVFASSECSFITTREGMAYGCGLNRDGQVGTGSASTAVLFMKKLSGLEGAGWIGGGTRSSAALVKGTVLTWGRAEECGHGLGPGSPPLLKPRAIANMPCIRVVRCGMTHMLACCENGDVFAWGCGITYQLGNRPRVLEDPHDAADEPDDELTPYRISSKQLEQRFVLMADGGAQHSVELAWYSNEQIPGNSIAGECSDDEIAKEEYTNETRATNDPHTHSSWHDCGDAEVIHVTSSEDFWRVQIESVYRRRNPYKLGNVPALLKKYAGREAILYAKVCKVYDLDPTKFYADPRSWDQEDTDIKQTVDEDISGAAACVCDVASSSLFPGNGQQLFGPGIDSPVVSISKMDPSSDVPGKVWQPETADADSTHDSDNDGEDKPTTQKAKRAKMGILKPTQFKKRERRARPYRS